VRSLHGPKWAQASSPAESKADPDRRAGHNAWPSGAGRLCQNKGLARTGTGPHPGSWNGNKEPMRNAGQGCGKRFSRPPDVERLEGDVLHAPSDCRPGGGASERGNGSDGFQGWDDGRTGGDRLEEKDALRLVPEGHLPTGRGWIRSAAGCKDRPVPLARSRRASRPSPRAGGSGKGLRVGEG